MKITAKYCNTSHVVQILPGICKNFPKEESDAEPFAASIDPARFKLQFENSREKHIRGTHSYASLTDVEEVRINGKELCFCVSWGK